MDAERWGQPIDRGPFVASDQERSGLGSVQSVLCFPQGVTLCNSPVEEEG